MIFLIPLIVALQRPEEVHIFICNHLNQKNHLNQRSQTKIKPRAFFIVINTKTNKLIL